MSTRALVAYATKHGSTRDIAETIGHTLRDRGIETDIMPVRTVASIDDYRLVIVGSAVYTMHWQGEAIDFLKYFEAQLRELPVWAFGSGPTGGSPKAEARLVETLAEQPAAPGNARALLERIGAKDYRTFGGRISPEMGGIFERWVPKGDWRDFDAIRAWANTIADAVVPVVGEPVAV
jgi:menaquinone-dependent protoporphyrinogen oxidase